MFCIVVKNSCMSLAKIVNWPWVPWWPPRSQRRCCWTLAPACYETRTGSRWWWSTHWLGSASPRTSARRGACLAARCRSWHGSPRSHKSETAPCATLWRTGPGSQLAAAGSHRSELGFPVRQTESTCLTVQTHPDIQVNEIFHKYVWLRESHYLLWDGQRNKIHRCNSKH